MPLPSLACLNVINPINTDGNRLNNIKVDEVVSGNDSILIYSVKEVEEQNKLHLKL